jgi:triacylglycerol lipase
MRPVPPVALTAAIALLALAALALWLLPGRRRQLRRRWRLPRRPRHPVILAHGVLGFDELAVGATRHAYFKGVREALEKDGCRVIVPRLPAVGSIAERAAALARVVGEVDARRVNVLAHSMGGLDARLAIATLGLDRRVAALVTVGTPHRGSPLADLSNDVARRLGLSRALALAGVRLDAFRDLGTEEMARFNAGVPDARDVAYASVVGVVRRKRRASPLLVPSHLWLKGTWGDNDGLVPASSQRWGEVLAEVEADHWAQAGWSNGFDAAGFYVGLLRELRAMGC